MTVTHHLRVHRSDEQLAREGQLAWRIAEVAADPVEVEPDVVDMIINRFIDNAAVAAASLTRAPVSAARQQALDHAVSIGGSGATVFGCALERRIEPGVGGVGERRRRARARLPRHVPRRRLLAPRRQHPADPRGRPARRLRRRARSCAASPPATRSRSTSCRRSACTSTRSTTSPTSARRPPPASAPCSGLDAETIYQAVGQALHTTTATRQSARARSRRGRRTPRPSPARWPSRRSTARCAARPSPSPIYEGEDGVIAWMLDGPDAAYEVPLPAEGEPKRGDPRLVHEGALGRVPGAGVDRPRPQAARRAPRRSRTRRTSSRSCCTPATTRTTSSARARTTRRSTTRRRSRETLDHSIPYIFAVALQDGGWHHVDSYAPERAGREDTVALWHKITTAEDAEWTRRYHSDDPNEKAFGGRVVIRFTDGTELVDEIAVADAHPLGARPFGREDYIRKFRLLAEPVLEPDGDRAVPRARAAPARAHRRRGRAADDRRQDRRARRRPGPEGAVLMRAASDQAGWTRADRRRVDPPRRPERARLAPERGR